MSTGITGMSEGKMLETITTASNQLSLPSESTVIQGSDVPDITTIAELRPGSYNKVIEARVYRKWISATHGKKNEAGFSPKKRETAYCCILIDRQV